MYFSPIIVKMKKNSDDSSILWQLVQTMEFSYSGLVSPGAEKVLFINISEKFLVTLAFLSTGSNNGYHHMESIIENIYLYQVFSLNY